MWQQKPIVYQSLLFLTRIIKPKVDNGFLFSINWGRLVLGDRKANPSRKELQNCDEEELYEKYGINRVTVWRYRREAGLNICDCGKPDPIELLSETDKAYIAGLLDADGYISMKGKNNTAYPIVGISQSDFQALEWMANTISASTSRHTQRMKGKSGWHREQMIVRISGRRAMLLCKKILPYLKIKRRQAEIILSCPYGIKGGEVDNEKRKGVHKKRLALLKEVRIINGRGRYAYED